jgi:predicted AAA+ superfamily ATPase
VPGLFGHRSVFLFGPRQTGKSTLVRASLPEAACYDLLEADTFRELSARPESLRQTLDPRQRVLVVDEIRTSRRTSAPTCARRSRPRA